MRGNHGLQAGNYVVNIYAGDISSKNKITVMALFKTKNIQKKYKKSSKFKIKLIKQNGKSVSKKNIKITLNSKSYRVKSNSNGIATFNIPKNLKIGKYTIKTSYNGCVVENKITVKKWFQQAEVNLKVILGVETLYNIKSYFFYHGFQTLIGFLKTVAFLVDKHLYCFEFVKLFSF